MPLGSIYSETSTREEEKQRLNTLISKFCLINFATYCLRLGEERMKRAGRSTSTINENKARVR